MKNKFEYRGTSYIVQSYLKNDFANICKLNGGNFRVDFVNNSITTSGKETKAWRADAGNIVIPELKGQLTKMFDL